MKAPFVNIKLITNEKKEFDLTDTIISFKYEDCILLDNLLEVTFAPDELIDLIDKNVIKSGSKLSFYFGYAGGVKSHLRTAIISDLDIMYEAGGKSKVSIKAMGKSAVMKKSESNKIWGDDTAISIKEIVENIANKYNMTYVIDDSYTKYKNEPQKGLSDFAFLKSLALREKGGNYIVYERNNTIFFVKRSTEDKSLATYIYGKDEDIISFKSQLKDSNKDASVGGLNLTTVDDKNKKVKQTNESGEEITSAVDLSTKKVTTSNTQQTTQTNIKTEEKTKTNSIVDQYMSGSYAGDVTKMLPMPNQQSSEAFNIVDSTKKHNKLQLLSGELVVEGNTLLEPDAVITMEGKLFQRDKGLWYIEKVVHSISKGYTCILEMKKGGKPATSPTAVDNTKKKDNKTDVYVIDEFNANTNVKIDEIKADGTRKSTMKK